MALRRCHLEPLGGGETFLLPGCYGGAIYNTFAACTCPGPERLTRAQRRHDDEVVRGREEVARELEAEAARRRDVAARPLRDAFERARRRRLVLTIEAAGGDS